MGSMSKKSKTLHHLPEEVIEEIFYSLPVKSLLRFKCVSKSWRSLISSKEFIEHHLKKKLSSCDHHKLIILHPRVENYSFRSCSLRSLHENLKITSFDHHPMESQIVDHIPMRSSLSDDIDYYLFRQHYHSATHYSMMMTTTTLVTLDDERYYPRESFLLGILGSCHGLILVSVDKGNLFLWNPTTRQAKNIAPPESHGFTRAWDRRCGYFIYGFGHDDTTDDYKIVSAFSSRIKRSNVGFPPPRFIARGPILGRKSRVSKRDY